WLENSAEHGRVVLVERSWLASEREFGARKLLDRAASRRLNRKFDSGWHAGLVGIPVARVAMRYAANDHAGGERHNVSTHCHSQTHPAGLTNPSRRESEKELGGCSIGPWSHASNPLHGGHGARYG